jgi:Putative Ig domain
MRRSRRGGHGGLEFGGSGEDSFVAVVVTKLTGALLFILLLTMVIMALLPKAIDLPSSAPKEAPTAAAAPLEVATPGALPEAIAGRPYAVALASRGGRGPVRWAVDGKLPEGLEFDPASGQIRGTPRAGTPEPVSLSLRASDGESRAAAATRLVVYQSDRPLGLPSKWMPSLPPIPWHAWLEQGFGFLVLWLVHLVGMNTLGSLQRWSLARHAGAGGEQDGVDDEAEAEAAGRVVRRRFGLYRAAVRSASLGAAAVLAVWLAWPRG